MKLLDVLPISDPCWDSVKNNINKEKLRVLSDVYIEEQVPPNEPHKYIGTIKEINKDTLVLGYKNKDIVLNFSDIDIGRLYDYDVSSTFGITISEEIANAPTYEEKLTLLKDMLKKEKMLVLLETKARGFTYAILNKIDDNYVYYTLKIKMDNKVVTYDFKIELYAIYNIKKANLYTIFRNRDIVITPIDYVKESTNYLSRFKEDDIVSVCGDMYNNLYILLSNGNLYVSDKKEPIKNVKALVSLSYSHKDIVAITNDNRIIWFNNDEYQSYFSDTSYDKVIAYNCGVVALKDGVLKVVCSMFNLIIDYNDFIDVEDIKLVDNEKVLIKKNGKWKKLLYLFD